MKKILLLAFSFTLLFCETNILIINSYHKGFDWSDRIIRGIEKIINENQNIFINTLYMDSKRVNSLKYYQKLKELYQVQLKNTKYDLIVVIDKFAYDFVLLHYHELFKNEKVFFIGLESYDKNEAKKYHLEHKISGIIEKRAFGDIIKIIQNTMPKLEKLYIINDSSANGDDSNPFIEKEINKIKDKLNIQYIRNSTLSDLKEKFSVYRENEAVFFVRFYNSKTGKLYKNFSIANMINSSKIPVFISDTLFIKKGAVGGKLVPIQEFGKKSAKLIEGIVYNKLKTPFIQTYEDYVNIFDYKKTKLFNLNIKASNFHYINEPVSFFDKHRGIIKLIFQLIPIFIFIFILLIYNLYLRIKSEKLLKQRMQFDKVLLNSIKNPILWQDEKGKIIGANSEFYNFQKANFSECNQIIKDNFKSKELSFIDKNHQKQVYFIKKTKYKENIFNTKGTVSIFSNITKEKLALDEKNKHQDFIIQQSKLAEIGEVFSSIAHQWKSPLVEITTIAQEQLYLLQEEIDEENSKFIHDIMVQVKYMTNTINDFQNFILPSVMKVKFDIMQSLQSTIEIINHNLKYNQIIVNIKSKENTNYEILGYKNEFMQTILNIINNAKDAIIRQKKDKKIKFGKIDIEIENKNSFLFILICDNGGGIPTKDLKNIFKPYFTTKTNGHGIGLYMAKLIIENKMNGKIYVTNERFGAKFIIKLEQS